jgi:hypothetical protein
VLCGFRPKILRAFLSSSEKINFMAECGHITQRLGWFLIVRVVARFQNKRTRK